MFIQTQIKENIKAPRHWPLCGEFTGTGEFPAQRASYAENVSIWWCHHGPWRVTCRHKLETWRSMPRGDDDWRIFRWHNRKMVEDYCSVREYLISFHVSKLILSVIGKNESLFTPGLLWRDGNPKVKNVVDYINSTWYPWWKKSVNTICHCLGMHEYSWPLHKKGSSTHCLWLTRWRGMCTPCIIAIFSKIEPLFRNEYFYIVVSAQPHPHIPNPNPTPPTPLPPMQFPYS